MRGLAYASLAPGTLAIAWLLAHLDEFFTLTVFESTVITLVVAVILTIALMVVAGDYYLSAPTEMTLQDRVRDVRASLSRSTATLSEISRVLDERAARADALEKEIERLSALGQIEARSASALLSLLDQQGEVATRRTRRDALLINAAFLMAGFLLGVLT